MKTAALVGVLLGVLLVGSAEAQTTLSVNINRATFEFTWTRGTNVGVDDGIPASWRWYCGDRAGAPGASPVDLPYTASADGHFLQSVKAVLKGPGAWYCSVLGVNQFGEGPRSNEIFFEAGTVPAGPAGLSITVK